MTIDFSNIQIETGIPLPEKNIQHAQISTVLSQLQVGHSFIVPDCKREGWLRGAKQLGIKLSFRQVPPAAPDAPKTVRIWRTE